MKRNTNIFDLDSLKKLYNDMTSDPLGSDPLDSLIRKSKNIKDKRDSDKIEKIKVDIKTCGTYYYMIHSLDEQLTQEIIQLTNDLLRENDIKENFTLKTITESQLSLVEMEVIINESVFHHFYILI